MQDDPTIGWESYDGQIVYIDMGEPCVALKHWATPHVLIVHERGWEEVRELLVTWLRDTRCRSYFEYLVRGSYQQPVHSVLLRPSDDFGNWFAWHHTFGIQPSMLLHQDNFRPLLLMEALRKNKVHSTHKVL